MKVHYFQIRISPDEWLRYYKGTADAVIVTAMSGLRISIPAAHFRPFTHFQTHSKKGVLGALRVVFLAVGSRFLTFTPRILTLKIAIGTDRSIHTRRTARHVTGTPLHPRPW